MPNTQVGLPSKDHLWKLPSLGTQPTSPRCALAFPRGSHQPSEPRDEVLTLRGVVELDARETQIEEHSVRRLDAGTNLSQQSERSLHSYGALAPQELPERFAFFLARKN